MTRNEQFKIDFEGTWGKDSWQKFCDLVYANTKVQAIKTQFPSAAGKPMSNPTYYKWEARAHEVKA